MSKKRRKKNQPLRILILGGEKGLPEDSERQTYISKKLDLCIKQKLPFVTQKLDTITSNHSMILAGSEPFTAIGKIVTAWARIVFMRQGSQNCHLYQFWEGWEVEVKNKKLKRKRAVRRMVRWAKAAVFFLAGDDRPKKDIYKRLKEKEVPIRILHFRKG